MGCLVRLAPALLLLTCACAHSITITPTLDALPAPGGGRIEKNVGYYIAPENLAKQVETPGGGGDKVKYLPYKEAITEAFLDLQNRMVKAGAFR